MSTTALETYRSLIVVAERAAKAYYDTDTLIMSDEEYDILTDQIQAYEDEYGWSEATDILDSVAGGQSDGGDVTHEIKMLSLAKANTFDELKHFIKTINETIGSNVTLIPEPKLDGLAVSVKYRNGEIIQVATRGNGQTGEDITVRIPSLIENLPTKISYLGNLEVRGEVFISSKNFHIANLNRMKFEYDEWLTRNKPATVVTVEQLVTMAENDRMTGNKSVISSTTSKNDFQPVKYYFANSRNAVAGSLRQKTITYHVPMSFATYDVYSEDAGVDYLEKLKFVQDLGFKPAYTLLPKAIRGLPILEAVTEFANIRSSADYPTDGIVLKANSTHVRHVAGEGSKAPKWAIAYKYPSNVIKTVVEGIEVNIGRTGRLSLRAKLAPVLLDGTVINYASLHNVAWLEEKDIRIGDTVNLRRANDVIPYVDSPDLDARPINAVKWEAPAVCPQCGADWDKTTLLWRCPSPSCGQLNGIIFAAGRDYFDWEGLSEAIITRLNDENLVEDIADVFLLTQAQLSELVMRITTEGNTVYLGEKVGSKIFDQIQKSKTRPLSAVIAALGVRTLGRTFGRRLEAYYGDMSKIVNASVNELTNVEGIAIKKAEIIQAGLQEKLPVIGKLAKAGVTMTSNIVKASAGSNQFVGKKVCITGSIPGYTRGQAQELLTELGAITSSSVSANTDYLVADDESTTSSKYKKAVELGTTIITPEAFLKLSGK